MKRTKHYQGAYMKGNNRSQIIGTTLGRLGVSALWALLSSSVVAANLNNIDVQSLPGDQVQLKISFDSPVAAPKGYTIDQPARIALDLPGVTNGLGVRTRDINVGSARSFSIVETKDRTRLILNLTALMPYETRVEGNDLFVTLGAGSSSSGSGGSLAAASSPVPSSGSGGVATSRPVAGGRAITKLDFRRGDKGQGDVVIELSDPSIAPDVKEEGGKIKLSFSNTQLPEDLRVRLDVKDFATPVQFVNAGAQGKSSVVTIEPSASAAYDYMVYQADRELIVSVKDLTPEEKEQKRKDSFAYTGEKLSLNFQDIEVRTVLQIIAEFKNFNLVASDGVTGNITLRLQNVPWDQALDLVLKSKGLDKRQDGNILRVGPAVQMAEDERQLAESKRQVSELAPLRREVVQINYAQAAKIADLFKATGGGAGTERGSLTVDDRTNSIIAYQTQERLEELRRIVLELDVPVRQVEIQARIVQASANFSKELGVKWSGLGLYNHQWYSYGASRNPATTSSSSSSSGTGGSSAGSTDTRPGPNYTGGTGFTGGIPGVNPGIVNSPFVDLSVVNPTTGFGIGYLGNNLMLDLQLNAMESTGNGEIVSQPKVVTSDKEAADISTGQEVPYQEASSSGSTSTSFKQAVLSLKVTPQITPDNRIIMDVNVNKDDVDWSRSVNNVPPINTNEVNAKVLVNDGETIVIGGVFSNSQTRTVEKVPFLGDVPVIGRLFRHDSVTNEKNELLIFLTPRIIDTKASLAVR